MYGKFFLKIKSYFTDKGNEKKIHNRAREVFEMNEKHDRLFETDKEFMDIFADFAFDEVKNEPGCELPEDKRHMAVLAALIGCGGTDAFKVVLAGALKDGFSPVAAKEIVYQAVDYLGMGRVLPFLYAVNEVMEEENIELPLPSQATTNKADRLKRGAETQAEIFGEHMLEAWKQGPVNKWLADNCFGDFYTRKGLDLKDREMITLCFLMAQGGCEPQLTAHAKGNMNIGNDKDLLIRVVEQCLPYIGYPRSLNAISCINKASEQ